jgi:hypothetical protein
MEEQKLNCWEVKRCGRERGGKRAHLGVCSAAEERRLDGVHGGTAAGRACWVIGGTLCEGRVQGDFAEKFDACERCDFYNMVKREESPTFTLSPTLRARLRDASVPVLA